MEFTNNQIDPARRASLPVISAAPTGPGYWPHMFSTAQFQQLLPIQSQPPVGMCTWEGLLTGPVFQQAAGLQLPYAGMGVGAPLSSITECKSEQSEPVTTTLASMSASSFASSAASPAASPIASPVITEMSKKRALEASSNGPDSPKSDAGKPAKKTRYQCSTCGKYFTRPSSLSTHNYTHTGEKPHGCTFPGCTKRFSVLSNLRRHTKLHTDPQPRGRRRSQPYRHYIPANLAGMEVPVDAQFHFRRYSEPAVQAYLPDLAALGYTPMPATPNAGLPT
ncbi:hypothetical protein IWW50_003055, partial [Coemansia erecta]